MVFETPCMQFFWGCKLESQYMSVCPDFSTLTIPCQHSLYSATPIWKGHCFYPVNCKLLSSNSIVSWTCPVPCKCDWLAEIGSLWNDLWHVMRIGYGGDFSGGGGHVDSNVVLSGADEVDVVCKICNLWNNLWPLALAKPGTITFCYGIS
jgi:hypothetical protein